MVARLGVAQSLQPVSEVLRAFSGPAIRSGVLRTVTDLLVAIG